MKTAEFKEKRPIFQTILISNFSKQKVLYFGTFTCTTLHFYFNVSCHPFLLASKISLHYRNVFVLLILYHSCLVQQNIKSSILDINTFKMYLILKDICQLNYFFSTNFPHSLKKFTYIFTYDLLKYITTVLLKI